VIIQITIKGFSSNPDLLTLGSSKTYNALFPPLEQAGGEGKEGKKTSKFSQFSKNGLH